MAISPLDQSSAPLSISIEINGKQISDILQVLSIQVHRKVNEVASAQLILGFDKISGESNLSQLMELFPLDGNIKISAGYGNKNTQIFNGLIAQHELKVQEVGSIEVIIHGIVNVKKTQPKRPSLLRLTYGVDVEQFQGKIGLPINGSNTPGLTGSIQFQGNALPQINTTVELRGFGDTFDGSALVNEVHHSLVAGGWKTRLGLGEGLPEVNTAKAQAPSLVMATVKQISGDPQEEYRVLVTMDNGSQERIELWAKMAQSQATNGSGTFFYPDIGDQVVLCFPNGDLNAATILGQCYSKSKKPAYSPDETNRYKAIVSRAGLAFEMDEKEKTIQLKTRGGQQILLSDQENKIVIKDSNGNSIELSAKGIILDSAKDIILKAKKDILLDATAKIDAKAKADINLEGLNIQAKAKVALEASGNASAELSAAGQVTIQGAMVMIN